jgi:hypothetical protein
MAVPQPITSVRQLEKIIPRSDREKQDISFCLNAFRMAITP